MATNTKTPERAALVKLGDTDLTIADPAEDVRGRTVIDRDGAEVGNVDSLLIDDRENKVRFLEVGSGGLLGIGEDRLLIPVDAVRRIDDDHVHIDQARQHVANAPRYDPKGADDTGYWNDIYGYYGYTPYWAATYAYPGYPYYV